jgi:23S rRNA (guanosine2251-2'-O)-methyltransferase
MNQRDSRQKTRPNLAASHQRSWLWGRHAVLETLAAGQWPMIELLIDEQLPEADQHELQQLLPSATVRVQQVTADRIAELCRSEEHQGFLARMAEFPCRSFDDLLSDLQSDSEQLAPAQLEPAQLEPAQLEPAHAKQRPLYVVCDRIQDAHNFGAILRCCDAMNASGVIIGDKYQASITPHVARASSGAVNHQAIYRVPSLVEAARAFKRANVTVLAASEKSEQSLWQANLRCPLCIVMGSEATGIAPELLAECNSLISIPMLGGVHSLNAAVAAGIVLYECRRQQLVSDP